jgi:hypothetical protein
MRFKGYGGCATNKQKPRFPPKRKFSEPESNRRKLNLPQIVYELTGLVMPRGAPNQDDTAEDMVQAGMDADSAEIMDRHMQLAIDIQCTSRNWKAFLRSNWFRYIQKQNDELPEIPELSDDTTNEELRTQLRIAKAQNDELRRALHEAERTAESAKASADHIREESAVEHQELLDLRELVFNQKSAPEDSDDEELTTEIQFPYQTNKRIVVFGGHDTWLKAIRPMLPDVTFINKGQAPNADMIRAAEVVWIQANALSHKYYYKIMNITRTNQIPVRYFGYSSARKCAVQLVAEDEKK